MARDSLVTSLVSVSSFLRQRGLVLSPLKSKSILFSNPMKFPLEPIKVDGMEIPLVENAKFLGMVLDK